MAKRKRRRRAPKFATFEELDRILPKNPPPRDPEAARRLIELVHGPGSLSDELAIAAAWRDAELRLELEEEVRREELKRELTGSPAAARPGRPPDISDDEWRAHVRKHPGRIPYKERAQILTRQLGRDIAPETARNTARRVRSGRTR